MSFEFTTVGEFATIQGGYAFKSHDFIVDSEFPVLKIKNIRNGFVDYGDTSFISAKIANGANKWLTNEGDILVSMTGSGPNAPDSLVGRIARVWRGDRPAFINQRVGRVVLKETNRIDPDFIYYVLSQKETQEFLVLNSTGSANQVNINSKTIESVPCPDIDYETSKSIAKVLRSLDKRIRLLGETNTTLETIAQALFKSWFVDFDPVHANAGTHAPSLPPEIQNLFPSTFVESSLGLVPEGWGASTVEQSFILTMGQSPPGDTYNEMGDGIPFYQGRTDFGFRFPGERIYCSAPTRLANSGDILVSVRAPVGDVNIALGACALGRGVAGLRHPAGHLSFVFYAIRCLKPYFDMYNGEGTVFGSINKKDFQNLPIVEPSSDVLEAFEGIAAPIDAKIESNEKKLRSLTVLRDTLLPRLISGQLRLPEVEEMLQ